MNPHDLRNAVRSVERGQAKAQLLRSFQHPQTRALRIGLTGGIGSGKTTVATALKRLGATLADADRIGREVVEAGSEGLYALTERFGEGILLPCGELDRSALAAIIFSDYSARHDVEKILHPLIAARAAQILARAPKNGLAVYDVPLLKEAGLAEQFDAVLVVEAPLNVRLERLEARGITRDDARKRMAAQSGDAERRALAHILIENVGSREEMTALVDTIDRIWLRPTL